MHETRKGIGHLVAKLLPVHPAFLPGHFITALAEARSATVSGGRGFAKYTLRGFQAHKHRVQWNIVSYPRCV